MTHPTNEAAERQRALLDDPVLYDPTGMKPQCTYIVHWHSCRLDAGHAGKHSPGRQASEAAPSPDPLPGRSCRHGIVPEQCEFCDSPGADKEEADRQARRIRAAAAPSLLQERDRLAERLYAALWDERVVLDAGIKGFDERRYRAAAKRIVGRLAATSTATEEPNE